MVTSTDNQYYRIAKRVTIVSMLVNSILALAKLIIGKFGHSDGLIADGVHSLADVITDILVLFAAKIGSVEADSNHPYGHGRFETLATVGLALLVLIAGLGIFYDAIVSFTRPSMQTPALLTLWIAAASILVNECLYHYVRLAGKKIQSNILQANAWHNRTDAASSLIVFIGILASRMGLAHIDSITALLVALLIIRMGCKMIWQCIGELVDTGVDTVLLKKLHETITCIDGVRSLHQLRSRSLGGRIFLDLHILVDKYISVSEGHYIGDQVAIHLIKHFQEITDVTVHIDPEDDEHEPMGGHLPSRLSLLEQLQHVWDGLPGLDNSKLTIHYLGDVLELELIVNTANLSDDINLQQLSQQYQMRLRSVAYVSKVVVSFVPDLAIKNIG